MKYIHAINALNPPCSNLEQMNEELEMEQIAGEKELIKYYKDKEENLGNEKNTGN